MAPARILVVDDEPSNRKLARIVLEPLGYTVLEADDGDRVAEMVAREAPDLVLLDVVMPRRDGFSVLQALKSDPKTRLLPVVLLTSLDQLPARVTGSQLGADDYLTKPFHPAVLAARVHSLVSLKRFTDELEHASRVLAGIARVVESRDRYTGDHCRRLGDYAGRIGAALGLSEEEIGVLKLGGVFHDLGKIAVSDTILNKPERLTPAEMTEMRRHPAVGAELVGQLKTLEKVLPLIRHHHEKLDGSGYPDGLKGSEIPLLVRIISVADVYDALATRRPYKEPLPPETCFAALREETAGGWWDREVVETLVRVLRNPA